MNKKYWFCSPSVALNWNLGIIETKQENRNRRKYVQKLSTKLHVRPRYAKRRHIIIHKLDSLCSFFFCVSDWSKYFNVWEKTVVNYDNNNNMCDGDWSMWHINWFKLRGKMTQFLHLKSADVSFAHSSWIWRVWNEFCSWFCWTIGASCALCTETIDCFHKMHSIYFLYLLIRAR